MSNEMVTAANPMSLQALVQSRPKRVARKECIDVTEFFPDVPDEAKPVLFWYREVGVSELFAMRETAQEIKFQHEDFTDELCGVVALLAVAHAEPAAELTQRYLMYGEMASNRFDNIEWLSLVASFTEKFPELANMQKAINEQKKT